MHSKDIKGGPTYPHVQHAPLSPILLKTKKKKPGTWCWNIKQNNLMNNLIHICTKNQVQMALTLSHSIILLLSAFPCLHIASQWYFSKACLSLAILYHLFVIVIISSWIVLNQNYVVFFALATCQCLTNALILPICNQLSRPSDT